MWCEPWVWDWNLPKLHFFGAQVIFFLGARKMSDFLHRRCAGLNLVVRIQQLVVQLAEHCEDVLLNVAMGGTM